MSLSSNHKEKEIAFKQLFEQYYAPFCIYAKRFIPDQNARKDIVSDVFTAVWEKMEADEFRQDTTVEYLQKAVRNQCINHLKHIEHEWDYAEWIQRKATIYAASPDNVYTLSELYSLLNDTIKKLPHEYRQVFIECFIQEKTQVAIAEEMNVSVKTINRYKQKIISILKENLKDYLLLALVLCNTE